MIFTCIKVIVPQSKAHILRRFTKIGRKGIEYSYVSGQCRQTIYSFSLFCNYDCLFVNFFSVKDFSATTWVRTLKFVTKINSDKLYCVTKKNSHILLISSFICSFFLLSNGNFCHRFLSSYRSQGFKILCTPSGRQSVLCKWNPLFSFLFQFFIFSFFHSYIIHMDIFSVKDVSATT